MAIVQQVVPHYRVPVFDLLARQPGIELTVCSAQQAWGSLKHVKSPGSYREHLAPFRKIGGVYWQPEQISIAKSGAFDVIIYSWNSRLVHLPRALRICRRRGVPTLLWGHGIGKHDSRWRQRLRDRLLGLSDGCILYGPAVAKRLIDAGRDPSRIHIALNSIDQSATRAARGDWLSRPAELESFRKQNGLVDRQTLLFISRLEQVKRVDVLLTILAKLRRDHPRVQLAIIGRGPEEQSLRDKAAALGVADCVRFVGALFKEEELAPWFLSAVCMPYTTNLGLSLLHAFGYGLPVVTSDDFEGHGPEVEAIRDEENSLLYRSGDVDHFAAQIARCLADHELREKLSRNALVTVRSPDGFCIERTVQGFMQAIASVRVPPPIAPPG